MKVTLDASAALIEASTGGGHAPAPSVVPPPRGRSTIAAEASTAAVALSAASSMLSGCAASCVLLSGGGGTSCTAGSRCTCCAVCSGAFRDDLFSVDACSIGRAVCTARLASARSCCASSRGVATPRAAAAAGLVWRHWRSRGRFEHSGTAPVATTRPLHTRHACDNMAPTAAFAPAMPSRATRWPTLEQWVESHACCPLSRGGLAHHN
jgi:hypothetical protein